MKTITLYFLSLIVILSASAHAENSSKFVSKYVGEEQRAIKSLSTEDLNELKAGAGWGLAKAAELNGLPGPKHILEMKNEIELSPEQEKEITGLFESMKSRAVILGNELIDLERELNNHFAQNTIDESLLSSLLEKISATYMKLRFVHLATHLKTPGILGREQIKKYNQLRGYTSGDPCSNIPAGHDPVMWRKHNDCE